MSSETNYYGMHLLHPINYTVRAGKNEYIWAALKIKFYCKNNSSKKSIKYFFNNKIYC